MTNAKQGSFRNPVLSGDRPDPAILKDGDDYWLTYSSFDAAPGLSIYHSTDLVNWSYTGVALPEPPGVVFAVDIAKVDGRYFIYIPFIPAPWSTLITEPSIYVIHAPSMTGPWSDTVDLGVRGAIDPGHVVGEDGKRYLFVNGVRRVELTDDGLATVGDLTLVYDGWQYPDEWITEAYALEGPKLLRRNGWFYLVSAVGGTAGPATGHMVIVARSRSIDGPWENSPHNPVARTVDAGEAWWSRGHATIFPGPGRDWWMMSHGYENGFRTLGRQLLLEPIEWTDDDWPAAAVFDISGELAAPDRLTVQNESSEYTEDFSDFRLGERWNFYAPAPGESSRIATDGSGLILAGKGDRLGESSPLTLVGGDHRYEVSVTVDLLEGSPEAGLVLFFNRRLFCGFGIDGNRMVSYAGGLATYWNEPIVPGRRIDLRLVNDGHVVTGWYRDERNEWVRHAVRYETSGYHANTMGDLQSLRPALYATGAGSAKFTDFRYLPAILP
ncbi:family 43 glycosylhydrolase [Agreia pratensis]|uniref:family 43 glycosylhydrolase n=1 Tax=Agreia pratensis TaxID=150121 RepID=UPI00188D6196|nr:family 43 glycosylhydrolase [Agreia pratensis]MBF4635299.1 family 43 glycosylhydrolase [Agreia pratensis]